VEPRRSSSLLAPAEPVRWLGFRLPLVEGTEALLLGPLSSWLDARRAAGELRSWFFLRYSEGGLHLRLRLLPRSAEAGEELRAGLELLLAELGRTVEPLAYDRREHAFGHNWNSVHAELAHEASSRLALDLLRSAGPLDGRRWALAAAATLAILAPGQVETEEVDRCLAEGESFAAEVAQTTGFGVRREVDERHAQRLALLATVIERSAASLEAHPALPRLRALLARLRRRGVRGRFVATHAVHLFLNEMGLSIHDEYGVFVSLAELRAAAKLRAASFSSDLRRSS
jgi:thiopeptide-type bacteriocin biosynthesis protein